ncbi:phosphate transporter (Pho88), partial [Friedmanniomyces endolithicus]
MSEDYSAEEIRAFKQRTVAAFQTHSILYFTLPVHQLFQLLSTEHPRILGRTTTPALGYYEPYRQHGQPADVRTAAQTKSTRANTDSHTANRTNLVIILGMMQVSKKIPLDDPNVLNGVRALYVVSNLLIVAIYLYTKMQIDKKRDMTVLKYVEPAAMGSTEEPKAVTTTVHAYDTSQLKGLFKSQLMGV